MKSIYLILLLFCTKAVQAHEPDLSNLMIYEQNGKCLLVIKSSLTAFEGEIDYLFGKNAYKSPEAFQQLVIKHFQNNCMVMMNGDTVKLINPTVVLGHETTLFAELLNAPNKVNSIYIRNRLFKNMPVNMCEIILTLKGLPQKQYILNNANKQEVKLAIENNKWTVVKAMDWSYKNPNLIFGLVFFLVVLTVIIIAIRENKKIKRNTF
jgi:hypothetical protein